MDARLARHQVFMLRGAPPGSSAARLRSRLKASLGVPAFCPRGHRINPSTGDCYTMRELEPGLYEYVIGRCEDLP